MKFTNTLALLGASACAVSMNNNSLETRLENLGQHLIPDLQYPGDKCCYLFKKEKYYGARAKVCHEDERRGFYLEDELEDDEDGDWNNAVSSYICGKNVWFNMCRHGEDSCYEYDLLSGAGHHKNPDIGQSSEEDFDNEITYMEMGPYEPSDVGAITLFEDPHCQGHATRVYWIPPTDENITIGGYYNSWDLRVLGMSKETKSSIMVPKGYKVDLIKGWGLETEEGLVSLLGKYKNSRSQEMECRNLEELGINDKVNSLIITKSDNAVGYWQAITSTESQEYKFHVGINTSSSESSASEIQDQLTFAAELGFEYGFVSGSASVSKSL